MTDILPGVIAVANLLMVAMVIPLGDKGMALAFAATAEAAAATFVGGEVGVCAIIGVARRELGFDKLCKYSR
jgi:hypothetical protein